MEFDLKNIDQLQAFAKEIIDNFPSDRIFLFYGSMGAGKTTIINALCEYLQVEDNTSSPTFSIVNEYKSPIGPIYHFDFYRLKSEEEALDLGYEDYFYSNNYCFIEWPENIPNLLPLEAKEIHIRVISPEHRKIFVK